MRGIVFLRPALLVLLLLAPAAWLAWRRWPPPLARRQSRFALILRLVVVVLLVLALAGLRITRQPDARTVVAVVDLSDSAQNDVEAATAAVKALAGSKGPDDLFGVVSFGRTANVEVSPARNPIFDGFQTKPDPTYSDLSGALELAANIVPDGFGRQLVLISDGQQNLGDAAATVSRLRSRAVRVDVVPIGAPPGPEALVATLDAPAQIREGQTVTANARLRATAAASGTVSMQVDGQQVATAPVDAPAGDSAHAFNLANLKPGLHRLRAVLDVKPDGRTENNVAEALVRVLGQPAVLVLEGAPGSGSNVSAALAAAGMRTETRPSEQTPVDPAALAAFDSIVVADAPADAFPDKALPAIAATVSDLGRGLVAIGGSTSYGPGGWQGTDLEKALPVRAEIPRRKEKPTLAVVVTLETMEYPEGDRVELGAIQSVLDQLGPEDEFGVVNMGQTGSYFSVPLAPVADKAGIMSRVSGSELGDPGGHAESLNLAMDALAKSTAATKHAIVIGDGDAIGDIASYQSIFNRVPQATVSVVGVDTHDAVAYMQHMRDMAKLGGGRYFQSNDATEVPDVLLKASRTALRPWFEQEPFFPKVTSSGDLLSGVPLDSFPQMGGYVATTAKGEADVAFTTPKNDPLLASWNYGLGRSVAWTSDARGRWTKELLASPVGAALFARMVAWSLPGPAAEGLNVEAVPAGDGLDVTVTGADKGGEIEVNALGPDLSRSTTQLATAEPGRWQGHVSAPQLGTYVLGVKVQRGGSTVAQAETLVTVPYSPEYLQAGRDEQLLRQLTKQGGAFLATPKAAWSNDLPPLSVKSDVFSLLLLIAVVLWPIEIGVRRLNLSPRGLLGLIAAIVTFRRPKDLEAVVPPSLSRLKQRIDTHRRGPPEPEEAAQAAQATPAPPPAAQEPVKPDAPVPPKPPASAPKPAVAKPAPPAKPTPRGPASADDESPSSRLLAAKRRRKEGD